MDAYAASRDTGFGDPSGWGSNNNNNHDGNNAQGKRGTGDRERATMKQITGLDGPWNNKPLSGSILWSALGRDGKKLMRRPYHFTEHQHPVFMKCQKLQLSAGSLTSAVVDDKGKPMAVADDKKMFVTGDMFHAAHKKTTAAPSDEPDDPLPPVEQPEVDVKEPASCNERTIHYYLCLYVPQSYLRHNATHLGDFDISRSEVRRFAHTWSFVLKSLSDLSVGIDTHGKNKSSAIDPLYFIDPVSGKQAQRIRAQVEIVLNTDHYNKYLPLDPTTPEMIEKLHTPDPYHLRQVCGPANIAGYRIHYTIVDPLLHPSSCFKKRIFANQEERNIIDRERFDYLTKCFLKTKDHADYMMDTLSGKIDEERNRKAREKARADAEKEARQVNEDGEAVEADDDEDGNGGIVPMDAAPPPPPPVGESAVRDDDGVEAVEDDGEGSGKDKSKSKPKRRSQIPTVVFDNTKIKLAEMAKESHPYTFYRNIFSLERFSKDVVHPYLRAANTGLALSHPAGIYTEKQTPDPLRDDAFDICNANEPLHFINVFNFANGVRLAQLTQGRKEGEFRAINSMQSDYQNYFSGVSSVFTFPFPHLVFDINPRDLDPEINYMYKTPWHSSTLDFQLDLFDKRLLDNVKRITELQAAKQDTSKYMSSSTGIFAQPNCTKFMSIAEQSHYSKARKLTHEVGIDHEDVMMLDTTHANPALKVKVRRTAVYIPPNIDTQEVRNINASLRKQTEQIPGVSTGGSMWTNMKTDSILGDPGTNKGDMRFELDRSKFNSDAEYAQATEKVRQEDFDRAAERSRASARVAKVELGMKRHLAAVETHDRLVKNGTVPSTLAELIKDSEHQNATYLSKVDALYSGETEDTRRVLGLIRRMGNPALNEELYNDLKSASNGGGGMVYNSKSSMDIQCLEDFEEMDAKISATLIEGCFAKQRKKMTTKMMRIISVVAAMPCKTEVATCQEWLAQVNAPVEKKMSKESGKMEDVKVPSAYDKDGGIIAYKPVYSWTPELEEHFRRDLLTRMMSLFYDEALSDALGLMSLDNPELPEVHAGFVLHLEKQQDKRFWIPKFTADPTMSRWGNAMALECMQLETVLGVYQAHIILLELLHSFRYGVLKQDVAMRMHLLIRGAPGTEKSESLKRLMFASISPAFMASDYQSKASHMTNQAVDHIMKTHDEAPNWICGDVARMSSDKREERDRLKKYLSSQEIAFQRSVESATKKGKGSRETENFRVSHIHSVLAFTNEISLTNEPSVLDRFRVLAMVPTKRSDCSMGERVLFADFGDTDKTYAEQFYSQKKIEHAILGITITAQNCRGLPENNTSLFTVLMAAGCNELHTHYPKINDRARAALRARGEADNLVYSKMYDRLFASEASPFIEFSDDKSRIDSTLPFHQEDIYKLFASGLFAEYDQCLYAMCNFFTEHISIRRFELVLEAVSEICGFNRDFLLPAYAKYQIPIPDIYRRAMERGQKKQLYMGKKTVKAMVTELVTLENGTQEERQREVTREEDDWQTVGDPDMCSFIKDFHAFELKLKAKAATVCPRGPSFEYGPRVDFESMEEKFNRETENKKRQRQFFTSGNGKNNQDQEGEEQIQPRYFGEEEKELKGDQGETQYVNKTHPTFLAVVGGDLYFAKQMLTVISKYEENIDLGIIKGMLSDLTKLTIRVPVFKGGSRLTSDTLEFEGTTLVNPNDLKETPEDRARGWKGDIHYEEVPVMEYKHLDPKNKSKGGMIRFATHFFMTPPHYLLYMFLTAHENRHTRRLSFPLPLPICGYPSLMHRWDVMPRGGQTLRIPNPRYVPEEARNVFANPEVYNFAHALNSTSVMTPGKISQRDTVQFVYDQEDLELTLYRAFIQDSHYSLAVDEHAAWKEEKHADTRLKLFILSHYNRPGATEEQIRYIRSFPFFSQSKNFKEIRYPDDLLRSMKRVARVKIAQKLRGERSDSEHLLPEERAKLAETIRVAYTDILPPTEEEEDQGKTEEEKEEELTKRLKQNEESAKLRDDLCTYLRLSQTETCNMKAGEHSRLSQLTREYGKMDWMLEYLMLKVIEMEEEEQKKAIQTVQNYQLKTRSTYKGQFDKKKKKSDDQRMIEDEEEDESVKQPPLNPATTTTNPKLLGILEEAKSAMNGIFNAGQKVKKSGGAKNVSRKETHYGHDGLPLKPVVDQIMIKSQTSKAKRVNLRPDPTMGFNDLPPSDSSNDGMFVSDTSMDHM